MSLPPPLPGARVVVFDEHAASAATHHLGDLVAELRVLRRAEADRVAGATTDWTGRSRTWFDHERGRLVDELDHVIARLTATIHQVGSATALARSHQIAANEEERRARAADLARLEAVAAAG